MHQAILENPDIRKLMTQFTVEKYHLMYDQGLIPEKTELLEGVIIEKMPKNPIHTAMIRKLMSYLNNVVPKEFLVSQESPIAFELSEPEPDISIVDYREDSYSHAHPNWAHLVIEVANTSLELDRQKSFIYARGKIPEYWIVNLNNNVVEVYRNPVGESYQNKSIHQKAERINPLFANDIQFQLSDFL